MTNLLLIIIAVLMLARIVLQIRQGKRVFNKTYASAYCVRKVVVEADSVEHLQYRLCEQWWYSDYEIVSVVKDKGKYYAFLQSKKIKNYYEE